MLLVIYFISSPRSKEIRKPVKFLDHDASQNTPPPLKATDLIPESGVTASALAGIVLF